MSEKLELGQCETNTLVQSKRGEGCCRPKSSLDQLDKIKKRQLLQYCTAKHSDKDCLKVKFGILRDLPESDVFNMIYNNAVYIGKEQPQTRCLFRKTENLLN